MKKSTLILMAFVPAAVGYIINLLLVVPVIGGIGFYLLPLIMTALWYYIGKQCAHTSWKAVSCILISHSVGIFSLLIYLWQFLLETDAGRNMGLAVFSQMFSASTPMYLFGGLARIFESQPNYAGRRSLAALQVIALVYMITVFSIALLRERNLRKN